MDLSLELEHKISDCYEEESSTINLTYPTSHILGQTAKRNNLDIYFDQTIRRKGFIVSGADGGIIAVNPSDLKEPDINLIVAHELGHFMTDAYYNENTPSEIRKQCESIANQWTIQHLIPQKELEQFYSQVLTWSENHAGLPELPNWYEKAKYMDEMGLIEEYNLHDLSPEEKRLVSDPVEKTFNILLSIYFHVPVWFAIAARIYYLRTENIKLFLVKKEDTLT